MSAFVSFFTVLKENLYSLIETGLPKFYLHKGSLCFSFKLVLIGITFCICMTTVLTNLLAFLIDMDYGNFATHLMPDPILPGKVHLQKVCNATLSLN